MRAATGLSELNRALIAGSLLIVLPTCGEDHLQRLGDACARDDECASGRCDEMVCKASFAAGIGEPCENAAACRSGRCIVGLCVAGLRGGGASCTDDQQCASGRCSAGFCAATGPDGGVPGDAATDAPATDAPATDGGTHDGGAPGDALARDGGFADQGVGGPAWCKQLGTATSDRASAVTVDSSGNVYLMGLFGDGIDLGGGALATGGSTTGRFAASYTAYGAHRWSRQVEGLSDAYGAAVGVDLSGNLYLAGSTTARIDLVSLAAANGADRWAQQMTGASVIELFRLGVDPAGAVYITGDFWRTVDLGGGVLTSVNNGGDGFVAGYSRATGEHLWSQRFGGPDPGPYESWEAVTGVALDASGNLLLTGQFSHEIDCGGGPLTTAGGNADMFLGSLTAAGDHRWSLRYGATGTEAGAYLVVGPSGNLFLAGQALGDGDFGGGILATSGVERDIVLASYDADGAHLWSKALGWVGDDTVMGLGLDASENLYLAGEFQGVVDFGGGALTSAGGRDVYIASYTASGDHRWSRRFGGLLNENVWDIAVDDAGAVIAAGDFQGTVDLGCGPVTSAGRDGYLVRIPPQ